MSGFFRYLWCNRVKSSPLSYGWWKSWVKRAFHSLALLVVMARAMWLSFLGARIGDLSVIGSIEIDGTYSNLSMGTKCVVGRNVHFALHDKISLGNNVVISPGCLLLTATHDLDDQRWPTISSPIVVDDFAWIATNAIILPGVHIGYGAVVGAGAVVRANVPPLWVVAGNPAELVRQRKANEYSYSTIQFLAPIEAWLGGGRLIDGSREGLE